MSLAPMMVIGCGGSGGKVVLGLRRRLDEELRRRKWERGLPAAWQLKWIDVRTVPESEPAFGPALPVGDYLGLSNKVAQYSIIDGSLMAAASGGRLGRVVGWRPSPDLLIPVDKGAGQMRGVGRAVALTQTQAVARLIRSSLGSIAGSGAELAQLSRHLGGSGDVEQLPAVIVVSSMAGGTGAGIFMDVCDVVRGVNADLAPGIFAVLFTAEIFANIGTDAGMAPNTAAAMGELMSGFLAADRTVESLYGQISATDNAGQSGPTIPLVVGMQPLGGGEPLQSPAQCYRAVTETLVAATINERFQQAFIGYQVTNFPPNADGEKRLTAFGMLNQPRVAASEVRPSGVVSSFGSAVVSVGSGRFGEWARDRLARAVLDHVVYGWREFGRQLMGDQLSAATTDQDVVDFLVGRDRAAFVDACGLWEENEPNGVEHNQVLDGILSRDAMAGLRDALRSRLLSELSGFGDAVAGVWQSNIEGVAAKYRSSFLGDIEKALVEGVDAFCSGVVPKVSDAVSEWLARFGVPVTRGLVEELRLQCRTAMKQLEADAAGFEQNAHQNVGQFVLGAFAPLGNGKCRADSEFVKSGLGQALGPLTYAAAQRRCEMAVMVLDRVIQRMINPLWNELADVGGRLADEGSVKAVSGWPDDGGDVSAVYLPAPSEFVLMAPSLWDGEYQRLLSLSAGSPELARDVVAGGRFEYGPVVDRQTAPLMVEFDERARWWDPNAGHVDVETRLRPDEVVDRVRLWMWDDNHTLGKFMRTGLEEYLSETGGPRQSRLNAFEMALSQAVAMAKPLVRIDAALMQRVHPGKDELALELVCEQFPFPPAMDGARAIVTRVMAGQNQPDGGWFMGGNTGGVESILITSILDNAVQPAVVSSLTGPIAASWSRLRDAANRSDAIAGFKTYNRARLLTESIPLSKPALQAVAQGWFLGRLLGVVTSATSTEPFTVRHRKHGQVQAAALPWPVLRHGDVFDLHSQSYGAEWLPALLEQLPIAMMMIGADSGSLDGYEQLFQIGRRAQAFIEEWVAQGTTPTGEADRCSLEGTNPDDRKTALLRRLESVGHDLKKRHNEAVLAPAWEQFVRIPYGYELLPLFHEAVTKLGEITSTIETGESVDKGGNW